IASTYAGQNTIKTVGTIGTGTWQGTTIASGYGGTGFTTYATGDIIYASGVNTLAKLAAGTDGQVLKLAGGVPTWAADGSFNYVLSNVLQLDQSTDIVAAGTTDLG